VVWVDLLTLDSGGAGVGVVVASVDAGVVVVGAVVGAVDEPTTVDGATRAVVADGSLVVSSEALDAQAPAPSAAAVITKPASAERRVALPRCMSSSVGSKRRSVTAPESGGDRSPETSPQREARRRETRRRPRR
jgi:hypothetical protein